MEESGELQREWKNRLAERLAEIEEQQRTLDHEEVERAATARPPRKRDAIVYYLLLVGFFTLAIFLGWAGSELSQMAENGLDGGLEHPWLKWIGIGIGCTAVVPCFVGLAMIPGVWRVHRR